MTGKRSLYAFVFCALAIGTYAKPAAAQTSRIYFAGYLGMNKFSAAEFDESSTSSSGEFEIKNSTAFAGALGVRLSRQLRFEGEYNYSRSDISSVDISGVGNFASGGEIKSKIIFANLYYDLDVPWKIQPYLGGGLGYGWHTGKINDGSGFLTSTTGEDANFMWNVAAGVKYRPSTDMAFTAGYRYVDSLDLNYGSYTMGAGNHEFRLGLEWDLPVASR